MEFLSHSSQPVPPPTATVHPHFLPFGKLYLCVCVCVCECTPPNYTPEPSQQPSEVRIVRTISHMRKLSTRERMQSVPKSQGQAGNGQRSPDPKPGALPAKHCLHFWGRRVVPMYSCVYPVYTGVSARVGISPGCTLTCFVGVRESLG